MQSKIRSLKWYWLATGLHYLLFSLAAVETLPHALWTTGFFFSLVLNQMLLYYAVANLLVNPYDDRQVGRKTSNGVILGAFAGKLLVLIGFFSLLSSFWADKLLAFIGAYLVQLIIFAFGLTARGKA